MAAVCEVCEGAEVGEAAGAGVGVLKKEEERVELVAGWSVVVTVEVARVDALDADATDAEDESRVLVRVGFPVGQSDRPRREPISSKTPTHADDKVEAGGTDDEVDGWEVVVALAIVVVTAPVDIPATVV